MSTELELDLTAEALERAAEGLRRYRRLVEKTFGNSPEEVKETLKTMMGFTPAEIRQAMVLFRKFKEGAIVLEVV